ncbi:hypothetical protein HUJ05_001533 [Dendroctonus ponderosae]|nr:hypothetical protein HUJ05_001533 [Dendroctonus ponderosae]
MFNYYLFTTLFIALWRRKENKLKFRWNCVEDVRETQIRQPYLDKAIKQQLNRITGEIEQYTPRCQVVLQYSLTFTACSILFILLVVLVLVNMVLKILLDRWLNSTRVGYIRSHSTMITMCLSSIITFYQSASVILTKIENPRTQCDFDNSVLYKRYLLGFMNNYVPTFYEAFFKTESRRKSRQTKLLNRKEATEKLGA